MRKLFEQATPGTPALPVMTHDEDRLAILRFVCDATDWETRLRYMRESLESQVESLDKQVQEARQEVRDQQRGRHQ